MKTFRAAVVQMCSRGSVDDNLARARDLIAEAVKEGAELVTLPENYSWMPVPDADPAPAHPYPGALVETMGDIARDFGCFLLLGGHRETPPARPESSNAKYYNASVLLDPGGEPLAHYIKRHLFDVDLADGTVLKESDSFIPGDDIVVTETPLATMGLSICYDLRFPEHYRALVDGGAEVLTAPSAFTIPTGKVHWHLLLRARAVENQCFMLAPAQVGVHGGDRASYGHSLIIDPWGEILAEIGEGEGVAVATLDAARLEDVRTRLPALRHRR